MGDFTDQAEMFLDRGDSDYLDFVATLPDGTVQDITSWEIVFTVKRGLADLDGDAVIRKTVTGGGVVITEAGNGEGSVLIMPADTSGLPNRHQRFYGDLRGLDPFGQANRLWKGYVTVRPSVGESF